MKALFRIIKICVFCAIFVNEGLSQDPKPKIIVGLVVDQMRWDYLYKYEYNYGDGGFNRLIREGFLCENTLIDHIPTYTSVGHSTVYTGSVPAIHGITSNNWIDQKTGQLTYCTSDSTVSGIGLETSTGMQSPKNLLVSTITDELKLATNFQSKVIGVALKDRSAILPAGHFGDGAYWYDSSSGRWITSSFYMNELPEWVDRFNENNKATTYIKDWHLFKSPDKYHLSIEDDNEYEGKWKKEERPVFPHMITDFVEEEGFVILNSTPFGNTMTIDFALEAIEQENLGSNLKGVPDFIAVSLSSPDYVGHKYSITSVELEDVYVRLDSELERLFNYLDDNFGENEYLFFITADHGASYNAKYYSDMGGVSGYFDEKVVLSKLNGMVESEFGIQASILSLINYQVNFNYESIEKSNHTTDALKSFLIEKINDIEGVAYVIDLGKGQNQFIPFEVQNRVANGYNRKRSGEIQIILEPQWYTGKNNSTGTTHGSWSSYDSHIPLVFMGWGINKGKTYRETKMTDIAPTLSSLLQIPFPNGNIGKPIVEVLRN